MPTGSAGAALPGKEIPGGSVAPGSQLVSQMALPADARVALGDAPVLEGSLRPISPGLPSSTAVSGSNVQAGRNLSNKTSDPSDPELAKQIDAGEQSSLHFSPSQTRNGGNSALPKEVEENSLRSKSGSSSAETLLRPAAQNNGLIDSAARSIAAAPLATPPANPSGDTFALPGKISSSAKPSLPMVDQSSSPAPPVKTDFNVRLAGEEGDSVNIRVYERAGEVQLSVRSSDPAVASHLRHELPAIHATLENAGWQLDSSGADTRADRETPEQPKHSHDERRDQQSALNWEQQSNKKRNALDLGWSELLDRQS
jgi:hypothetical protein